MRTKKTMIHGVKLSVLKGPRTSRCASKCRHAWCAGYDVGYEDGEADGQAAEGSRVADVRRLGGRL